MNAKFKNAYQGNRLWMGRDSTAGRIEFETIYD